MDKDRKKALKKHANVIAAEDDYLINQGGYPRSGLMHFNAMNPTAASLSDDEYLKLVIENIAGAMFPLEEATPEITFNSCDSEGDSVLHYACIWGDIRAVRLLIEAGANINHLGDMEQTPLHRAVMYRFLDIVELLLEKGAMQTKDTFGCIPLEWVKQNGFNDIERIFEYYENK